MLGLGHFLGTLIGHIFEVVVCVSMYVRFKTGAWLKTPAGMSFKAWCRANPALVAFSVGVTGFVVVVFLPMLTGTTLVHVGHKNFTAFDLLWAAALALFVYRNWDDGLRIGARLRGRGPRPTLNGTARVVSKARELAGKDDDGHRH